MLIRMGSMQIGIQNKTFYTLKSSNEVEAKTTVERMTSDMKLMQ